MLKSKIGKLFLVILFIFIMALATGCGGTESKDRKIVDKQQEHYSTVQPLPFYDYSIPRGIVIQIYNVVTQEARSTYTVIESITGETKFHGPSLGYGIPADVSLTNPKRPAYGSGSGAVIEQAEPNGLFSSKNTDGTWVLFVDDNGDVTPVYTEHKVTTYPFTVKKDTVGCWVRADDKKASLVVNIKKK